MEIAPKHNYVYEKCENGLKGGLCMEGGNPFAHLSIPIGVIVVREQSSAIPENHYNDYENIIYNTIHDELFDMLIDKCSQRLRNNNETRKKIYKTKSNVSKKK